MEANRVTVMSGDSVAGLPTTSASVAVTAAAWVAPAAAVGSASAVVVCCTIFCDLLVLVAADVAAAAAGAGPWLSFDRVAPPVLDGLVWQVWRSSGRSGGIFAKNFVAKFLNDATSVLVVVA